MSVTHTGDANIRFGKFGVIVIYTLCLESHAVYARQSWEIWVLLLPILYGKTHTVYACSKFENISVVAVYTFCSHNTHCFCL